MADRRASSDSINEKAIHWAVEMAYGEMTTDMRLELDSWLAADTRHRGAYVRARAWMHAADNAVVGAGPQATPTADAFPAPAQVPLLETAEAVPGPAPAPAVSRESLARWSGRAAAACAALAASWVIMVGVPMTASVPQGENVETAKRVSLADGSVATLSPDGRIATAFSSVDRQVTLVSGAATFNVARDKARPFVVRSGEIYAQATGTVYSVRRSGPTGGTVQVKEGSVLVWPRDDRDQAVLLRAGGSVTLDPGPAPAPVAKPKVSASLPPRLPPPELAQISLDNVPVKSAVARFNQINSTKIIIADAAIGETTIIGLYRANDPAQFAEAVAAISGANIEYNRNKIVIKMK